ncbi:MAG TPA: nucleoside triphosphate pyrophosphatase [Stellaceae bacterium]|nr:nucleoside triphosphate pyrophosphatase [Stellaceae bacterium]
MSAAPPLVLASASSTRRRLLAESGVVVCVDPASIPETEMIAASRAKGASAGDCAVLLAEAKAAEVSARHPRAFVIGADQMLDCEGDWLEKPLDLGAARAQLARLRGRTHRLFSAVAVLRDGRRLWSALDRAALTMRPFSDAFLDDYLARTGDDALHSVGAYRLEGLGAQLFERIEGDFFTILGLPLLPLLGFLREEGALIR